MRLVSGLLCAAALTLFAGAASAQKSGNYLLTLFKAYPSSYVGASACVTVTKGGHLLGDPFSGSLSFGGGTTGFYAVSNKLLTGYISLGGGAFDTLTGQVNGGTITGNVIQTDSTGAPQLFGSYNAVLGGC